MVTVTIALPVLLGMTGFAIDAGRLYAAQARLQAGVDAAALAGSLQLVNDPEVSNGKVSSAVTQYLTSNYQEAQVVSLQPGSEVRSICITGHVDVPMTFMAALGVGPMAVEARSCAGFNDLEVVLVIDNSGSMSGTPISKVRTAAKKLVDLLMPSGGAPSIKVGLVPFRGKVQVANWADGLAPGCRNANGTINTTHWGSCFTAMPPIKELTWSKNAIKSAIDQMTATGDTSGTIIPEGIKWGRHVLTTDYPYTEGGLESRFRKIMILLTDGDNEDGTCGGANAGCDPRTDVNCAYRRNAYFGMTPMVTNCNCNNYGCLDQTMLNEAQFAKDLGIEIFTIRYGTSDSVDIALMKAMASSTQGTDDHYFDAPSTTDIGKVFDKIGRQLGYRLL